MRNYKLTREQFLSNLYSHMKERVTNPEKSIQGRHYLGLPICSRDTFVAFGMKDRKFNRLFKKYKLSRGQRKFAPTVDRINNRQGYTQKNIQFLTLTENSKKDRKVKWIVLRSLDSSKVYKFYSTGDASRFLNHRTHIKLTRKSFINMKTRERFSNLTNLKTRSLLKTRSS